jgi:L-asparaginase II
MHDTIQTTRLQTKAHREVESKHADPKGTHGPYCLDRIQTGAGIAMTVDDPGQAARAASAIHLPVAALKPLIALVRDHKVLPSHHRSPH